MCNNLAYRLMSLTRSVMNITVVNGLELDTCGSIQIAYWRQMYKSDAMNNIVSVLK